MIHSMKKHPSRLDTIIRDLMTKVKELEERIKILENNSGGYPLLKHEGSLPSADEMADRYFGK